MPNIVAIVGRPNVGKSTLFNRLTGKKEAIVDAESGVTRDRHYGRSDWNGIEFSVIDTGGYVDNSDDVFEDEIKKQVRLAIEEADTMVFMDSERFLSASFWNPVALQGIAFSLMEAMAQTMYSRPVRSSFFPTGYPENPARQPGSL